MNETSGCVTGTVVGTGLGGGRSANADGEADDDQGSRNRQRGPDHVGARGRLSLDQPKPDQRRGNVDPTVRRIRSSGKRGVHARQRKREGDEAHHTRAQPPRAWRRGEATSRMRSNPRSRRTRRARRWQCWWSLFEQGAEEVSGPCRSGQLKEHRSAIGFHRHAESKEPAAVTFGLDSSRDERDRFCGQRKLETQSVREILPAFRTHAQDPLTSPRDGFATLQASTCKRSVVRALLCPFVDSARHVTLYPWPRLRSPPGFGPREPGRRVPVETAAPSRMSQFRLIKFSVGTVRNLRKTFRNFSGKSDESRDRR